MFSIAASPDQTILCLGGSFTRVNGVIRNRIAAVNRATGKLIDTFQPKPDTTVRAIVATSKTVYFGGLLGAVSGVTRPRLAAVQASDGKLLSRAPVAAGRSVQAMALSPAGSTYRYRVFAHDPMGNETRSDTVAIVASTTGTLSPYASAVLGDHPNSAGSRSVFIRALPVR